MDNQGNGKAGTRLAANVRAARIARGMTQQALSEKAGLSVTGLQRIESGERWPRAETLDALCDALDCGPADLFGDPLVAKASEPAGSYRRGQVRKLGKGRGARSPKAAPVSGPVVLLPFDLSDEMLALVRRLARVASSLKPSELRPLLELMELVARSGPGRGRSAD